LKRQWHTAGGRAAGADEPLPTEQGLKQCLGGLLSVDVGQPMSRFQQNKD